MGRRDRRTAAGDRMSIWLLSRAESVLILLLWSRMGYVCNPSLHHDYICSEIRAMLEHLSAAAFFGQQGYGADSNRHNVFALLSDLPDLAANELSATRRSDLASCMCAKPAAPCSSSPDRVMYPAFTSGTTGLHVSSVEAGGGGEADGGARLLRKDRSNPDGTAAPPRERNEPARKALKFQRLSWRTKPENHLHRVLQCRRSIVEFSYQSTPSLQSRGIVAKADGVILQRQPMHEQQVARGRSTERRSSMEKTARLLVTDHPRARGRKALGARFRLGHQPGRLLLSRGTAATAGAVLGLVLIERFWRVAALLIGGVRLAFVLGHAEDRRRGQDHARRFRFALRAVLRQVAFRHRPHIGERTAIVAEIFVDGHFQSLRIRA